MGWLLLPVGVSVLASLVVAKAVERLIATTEQEAKEVVVKVLKPIVKKKE